MRPSYHRADLPACRRAHEEPRRVDVWYTPEPGGAPLPGALGLFGRVLEAPATVELCHNTPTGDELADYVIKHGQLRRHLATHEPPPPVPVQWVISSGRPRAGIAGLWLAPLVAWPAGIYAAAPLLHTRLVVVSELEATWSTLLLRLLGRGAVLRQAITELSRLADAEPERRLALPILVRLRLEIPADPRERTMDDQQYLEDTQDIVERWRQEAFAEGASKGAREGFDKGAREGFGTGERLMLLKLLRQRYGAEVDGAVERRVAAAPVEQVEAWAERLFTAASLGEVFAE